MPYSLNLPKDNRYDCHIHSCYSKDSNLSCSKILEVAKKKGLKLIAITDHGTIKGGLVTKRLASDYGIDVLVGAEVMTTSGEIMGFNLKNNIKSRELIPVLEEIKSQGGLVVIPHPARWNKKMLPFKKIAKYIDYIEVYNGRNLVTRSNKRAYRIAKKFNIKPIIGSDSHFAFEIGNVGDSFINWKGFFGFFMTGALKVFYTLKAVIKGR